jgi:ABC-type lipoprotein export system ATPase subunit
MIEVKDLTKIYPTKERDFVALKDVNLKFEPGEFIAVLGESGSGKTTFLNMISGVDVKTSGSIVFNEKDVDKFNDSKWREIRNQEIGFIFQRFNLIDHLTVMENVVLPLILTGSDNKIAREIARRLLKEVDLEGIEDKLASELSGGQRQRVAIARTIIINPTIILADEPTGALDSTTAKEIMALLQRFAAGRIIIMVTHDEDLAYKNATRVVRLHDGEVISDEIVKEKNPITRDKTNQLLLYETKVTRKLKRRLSKQFPEMEEDFVVGQLCKVPLERKYVSNNPVFTRKIARENYRQKLKINRRILWSFVISISLLLVVNIVMKNITDYNFNLFDVNNNYQQFLVDEYDDSDAVLQYLEDLDYVDEALLYHEHYVQELYLVTEDQRFELTSQVNVVNKGVLSPKIVTLPTDKDNFYLQDQLLVGHFPSQDTEMLVTSEFLLSRFYGLSLDQTENVEDFDRVDELSDFVGQSIYVCGETIITGDDVPPITTIQDNCYGFEIAGVLNSFYNGINYAGHLFTTQVGFQDYIEYLKVEENFTRADEYYETYVSFYVKDIDAAIDLDALSDEMDANVFNSELRQYYETRNLEDMLYYIYLAIFFSLIIISGTIDINIVASSVTSRIREIGIYSCIGVSKRSIRNMFVFETVEIALRIFIITSGLFGLIVLGFRWLYPSIVVDLRHFESLFGANEMFSLQVTFSGLVIVGAVVFLFVSVLIPSFKAANMRAIDALRSE